MRNLRRLTTLLAFCAFLFAGVVVLHAGNGQPTGFKVGSIQVVTIQSDEISVPVEFRVALYENLIRQLEKQGFEHVYRDGDRNSAEVPNLVILHTTVRQFKPGSEKARQVTTIAGATSITVRCHFTDRYGHALLEQDVTGKVRFFGGNLRATYDFAKKASLIASRKFLATDGK